MKVLLMRSYADGCHIRRLDPTRNALLVSCLTKAFCPRLPSLSGQQILSIVLSELVIQSFWNAKEMVLNLFSDLYFDTVHRTLLLTFQTDIRRQLWDRTETCTPVLAPFPQNLFFFTIKACEHSMGASNGIIFNCQSKANPSGFFLTSPHQDRLQENLYERDYKRRHSRQLQQQHVRVYWKKKCWDTCL